MADSSIHTVNLFSDARAIWDAMYRDCEQAQSSIAMEQYILMDNAIGIKFMQLFIEKQKQGVDICLILDRIGCRRILASQLCQQLQKHGGRIHSYNPLNLTHLFFPKRCFPRNHNKLKLIDKKIAYIGSSCIDEHMYNWREMQIRIKGPFSETVDLDFVKLSDRLKNGKKTCAPEKKIDRNLDVPPYTYTTSRSRIGRNPIYKNLLERIRDAKKHIILATPYFFPPRRLRKVLRAAIKRGVRVDLITSRRSDKFFADCIAHSYMPKMLRIGIHVHLFPTSVFHAKYVITDDHWAMLGSTNLDYLSLMFNRESNVMITDKDTIQRLKKQAEHDIADSDKATKDYWTKEPFLHKCIGYGGRLFRKVL